MDDLIAQGHTAPLEKVRLCLWMLALGFQGRLAFVYESAKKEKILETYRYQLTRLCTRDDEEDAQSMLFPQNYNDVISNGERLILPTPGLSTKLYVILILGIIGMGSAVWWWMTDSLRYHLSVLRSLIPPGGI